MNDTFKVKTLFDCSKIEDYKQTYIENPLWAQTVYGCRLLLMLQDMYGFNGTYGDVISKRFCHYNETPYRENPYYDYLRGYYPYTGTPDDDQSLTEEERLLSIYPRANDSVDIYAKPLGFSSQLIEISCPIEAIFTGRYGFILKRPHNNILGKFYSLPFTRPVWNYLYLTILVVSGIFFYLSRWEKKMLGGYSCYHYELLFAIGACCQHILPLQTNMSSRRIAYFSFILSVYVLNSFYCSNLLSHLVSDKDSSMDLHALANSDYKFVKLGTYNSSSQHTTYKIPYDTNISTLDNKLSQAKYMNMIEGLNAVMNNKTALLSEYSVLYPVLVRTFKTPEICELIEIDLYSNIKKYFFTSKSFPYQNEFKIGVLRAKETGVLKRILLDDVLPPLNCAHIYPMKAEFEQIITPLVVLLMSYALATVIMLLERWHHRRNKVWPYVD